MKEDELGFHSKIMRKTAGAKWRGSAGLTD
jgi:hypothetical protein